MTSLRRRLVLAASALSLVLAVLAPSMAQAAPAPAWQLSIAPLPNNFPAGAIGTTQVGPGYGIALINVGGAGTTGPITITDTFPTGLTPNNVGGGLAEHAVCEIVSQTVTCTVSAPVESGQVASGILSVNVSAALAEGTTLTNTVAVTGGGALEAQDSTDVTISSVVPSSFDFLTGANGLSASVVSADGSSPSQAGSHPDQLNILTDFPAKQVGPGAGAVAFVGADGGVHNLTTILPPGLVLDPRATPRCTEAQLEAKGECPEDTQIGLMSLFVSFLGGYTVAKEPFYNMVPPPDSASNFAFNAAGSAIYPHLLGGAMPGDYRGGYALGASFEDILNMSIAPILGGAARFWSDPAADSHNYVRGRCAFGTAPEPTCPLPQPHSTKPLLSLPSACQASLTVGAKADSWNHQGVFHERSALFTDALGNPTGVTGCGSVEFEPTLKARPTTNVADSPSGLEVDLHIPQTDDLGTLAVAQLKDTRVTLPEGLVIDPSSANGLGSCSPAQVGIDASSGVPNGAPPACPDAAKLGTVEVDTPLVDHPLPGAIYLATPYDNPFGSLLAIYVVVDDPASGTIVKLSGHVEADPNTGRLTTTFSESPQLPFEDFKLNFFGGAGGALRTPATCGPYSTFSSMAPWSGNPPVAFHDDYAISQSPSGGSCPTSPGGQPNAPSLDAGSLSPIAGASTPEVTTLRRGDGSQEFSQLSLTLPPGLTGKLAGIAYCPDSALAAAAAKSGHQEQSSPSCPASSRIGTVDVAAGAGPAPYNTQGTAYLTGPYKGGPVGMAIITPAVAGPYDLGTVVTRVALRLDASTGQITAVSDPLPHILQGIPLDIRSASVKLDRQSFTRNGTSCDPLSFSGSLTSVLNATTPLSERFQLGECKALAFKPKLGIRLFGGTKRGSHPALKGTVTMPAGGANIAKAVVALPHSEFLDQAHIGTVCTRVQFAEGDGDGSACPAASIYGRATAASPLVDYALEGNAYLRSSTHELPDLVIALHGPASQPVAVDVVGRIDSVKGGIRTSFEGVPDLPVSSFVLSMQGGKKGLLQNSTNICKGDHKATTELDAQNGKAADLSPALRDGKCGKAKRRHKKHRRHNRAR